MRYVIIGASAAGCQAAETLRRCAPHSTITLISEEPRPLYSRPLLTYWLSGEVNQEQLWLQGEDYFRDWGFKARLGEPVTGVHPDAREVRLASGTTVPYDKLLLATGARPRLPGIPGEDLAGVFTLRTLADGQRLLAGLPESGPVAVVGAGAVGLKAAEALRRRGHRVLLLEAAAQALPRMLDPEAAALLHQALADLGVEFLGSTSPAAVLGQRGKVRALALTEGREVPAAAVLFATGVSPKVEFLAGTGLTGPEGLSVNARQQTSHPDIYAAGDCTRAPHFLTGQPAYYPIWPAAAAQGRVAGANMAGAELTYGGLLPQNSISLGGFHLITGGLGPEETAGCELVTELDPRRGHYRRLVYREGRLVGLTFVGAVEDAGLYFQLMAQQEPVPERIDPGRLWGQKW
jgi:nitrite reductase (NADH) large subunit